MILRELAALAEREKLVADDSFDSKGVAWIIFLDRTGRYLKVERTAGGTLKGRKRPEALKMQIPRQPIKTSGIRSSFIVDKAEYVLALPADDTPKKKSWAQRCHKEYCALLGEAVTESKDDALRAAAQFVGSETERANCIHDLGEEVEPNDLLAFHWDEGFVHDRPAVRQWWRSRYTQKVRAGTTGQCLVTGKTAVLAPLHQPIKRVPGPPYAGAALVSFNDKAYESYGMENTENAPVSHEAMIAYTTALNRLLDEQWRRPDGSLAPVRRVKLSSDSVAVFWARSDNPAVDGFASIFGSDPNVIREALRSVHSGSRVHVEDTSEFFALILSGPSKGRIAVRSWLVSTVADAVRNINRYFQDLQIARWSDAPIPLFALLRSLAARGDLDRLPPNLAQQIFEAALFGRPFPLSILEAAVRRCRVSERDDAGKTRRVTPERAALIRACLNRLRGPRDYPEVKPTMDETNQNRGYVLGRLLAELEQMQRLALGDIDAGIVDRYFGAACATPQAVFPKLMKLSMHHYRKAASEKRAAANAVQARIGELSAAVLPPGAKPALGRLEGFPPFLALKDQGLFVLGYHGQRHWNRTQAAEARERKELEGKKEE